jgi:signal transduction histidine kinase
MQDMTRSPNILTRYKYLLTLVSVTLAAVLVAEGVALGIAALLFGDLEWSLYLTVVLIVSGLAGLLLGVWANRHLARRVARLLEISRAWLLGTLSLRIADHSRDDLGMLAEQLDALAEHLKQDEQDLAQLREYSTRLSDQVRALAVDEERERLARELHDGVKQHLFSLSMTTSALRTRLGSQPDVPEDVEEMASEVDSTAKTVQRSLTRLIENLRPAPLQEKGLAAALNDYTLLFGAREHILVYLDVQGNDALLPPSAAEALYRVAQEALHNVARHARATRVDVRLRCLPEQVILTLRDNGVGFDVDSTHRGLGLGNMQDRMMAVGGRVQIDSQIGGGTLVRAEVGLGVSVDVGVEATRPDRARPNPAIENWMWLGQRLVIPVGQTWPWLVADQVHLRQPLVEPGGAPWLILRHRGPLGLKHDYVLQSDQRGSPAVRIRHRRHGYEWRLGGALWALRHVRGPKGTLREVLLRNGQPLAAAQRQGRLLNTWSEFIYDGRGYSLSCSLDSAGSCVLADRAGEEVLSIEGGAEPRIELRRALPLPLLAMVAVRIVDETAMEAGSS